MALYREIGNPLDLSVALIALSQALDLRFEFAAEEKALVEAESLLDEHAPARLRWSFLQRRLRSVGRLGRLGEAQQLAEEALKLAHAIDDFSLIALSLESLQLLADARGDWEEVVTRGRELVAAVRGERFPVHLGRMLCNLARALAELDRIEEAVIAAREAVVHLAPQGQLGFRMISLAWLASKRGRPDRCTMTLGRADASRLVFKWPYSAGMRDWRGELLASLAKELGEPELKRLLDKGAAMSDEEAAHAALDD